MPEEQSSSPEAQPEPKPKSRLITVRLSPYYYDLFEKFMKHFNIRTKSQTIRKMMEDGAKSNNIQ